LRVLIPLLPVYNHRLGVGYLTAILRARGHEVVLIDFEHLLHAENQSLSLKIQEETEVYADRWSEQIQYLHRPELLFGALFPDDSRLQQSLDNSDWTLIELLRPYVHAWADAIHRMQPELVLFPTLVSNLWIALWTSEWFHRLMPSVPRVFGGRGITYPEVQELILHAGWADGLLQGEAENGIAELVDALASGSEFSTLLTSNLVRLQDERVVAAPIGPRVVLDALPFPDFSGLPFPGANFRLYAESGRDFHDAASVAGSRWCPRHCAYCYESIYPNNYRLRKVDSVIREIEFQQHELRTVRVFFCDSTLNVSQRWLGELAEGMARLPILPNVAFAHCEPRQLDRGLLNALREAGFEKLNFGIESFDGRTLHRMNRTITVEETERTVLSAVEAGISVGLNLVANYPGETAEEFDSSLARARKFSGLLETAAATSGASVRFMVSQARVDPHSALFTQRERFGVRLSPRSLPVFVPLQHLRPWIERIALNWDDGLPRQQRRQRFAVARPYLESLSIPGRMTERVLPADHRVPINIAAVPSALRTLLPANASAALRQEEALP